MHFEVLGSNDTCYLPRKHQTGFLPSQIVPKSHLYETYCRTDMALITIHEYLT